MGLAGGFIRYRAHARRAPEFKRCLADSETRPGRHRLQLCLRLNKGERSSRRAVRRDLPDAQRPEGAAVHDLHGHGLGAFPRLHHAASAQRGATRRRHDFVRRRPHGDSPTPVRSAEQYAEKLGLKKHLVFSRLTVSRSAMCRTSFARNRRAIGDILADPQRAYLCLRVARHGTGREGGAREYHRERWACNGARYANWMQRKAGSSGGDLLMDAALRGQIRPSSVSLAGDGRIAILHGSLSPGGWRFPRWRRWTPGGNTSSAPTGIG